MHIFYTLFSASAHARWENPSFLSPSEHARLPAERFAKRRADWLLGRWTAKALLRAVDPLCAALPLSAISIENELGGAPFYRVEGAPDPHPACLSVSHSRETAFCALSFDLILGADLEYIEPRPDIFIEDYLTTAEARAARQLGDADRHARVTLAWSAKEAAFKALRIGLRADTRAVEVLQASDPGTENWGELSLHTSLPNTQALRGWWREENGFILTLVTSMTASPQIKIHRL